VHDGVIIACKMTTKDWVQLAVTLVGMVVGPLIAIQLSLKQFRSQKWWEKQEQAYSQLLSSLSLMRFSLFHTYNHLIDLRNHEMSEAEREAIRQARHTIDEIANSYVVSKRTAAAADTFLKEFDSEPHPSDPMIGLDKAIDAINQSIKIANEEAIKDVKMANLHLLEVFRPERPPTPRQP
jgi:hypothetical protein